MEEFKPSLEMGLLIGRVSNGDLEAIPELWALLFDDKPLDPKRPIDDIANDMVERLTELNKTKKNESSKGKPTQEDIDAFISSSIEYYRALMDALPERRL